MTDEGPRTCRGWWKDVSIIRRVALAATAAAVVVTVSGCAATTTGRALDAAGSPAPASVAPTNWHTLVAPADRAAWAERDQMRALDPCGFLDSGVVHGFGPLDYFGNDVDPDKCDAEYADHDSAGDVGAVADADVSISLIPLDDAPPPADGPVNGDTQVHLGSVTADQHVMPTDGAVICFIFLPYNTFRGFQYSVTTIGADPAPACTAARKLVAASLPDWQRPVTRAASTITVPTKAARLDPCDALDRYRHQIDPLIPMVATNECNFDVGTDSLTAERTITYGSDQVYARDHPDPYQTLSKRVVLDGAPVDVQGAMGGCVATAYVGAPYTVPGRSEDGQWIDMIKVTSGSDCGTAKQLATAAIESYDAE